MTTLKIVDQNNTINVTYKLNAFSPDLANFTIMTVTGLTSKGINLGLPSKAIQMTIKRFIDICTTNQLQLQVFYPKGGSKILVAMNVDYNGGIGIDNI